MSWKQPCEACRVRIAEVSCTKPTLQFVFCAAYDVRFGDRVCRANEDGPKNGVRALVANIEITAPGFFDFTLAISRAGAETRMKRVRFRDGSTLRRAVMAPCGRALCDQCAQDPGEPHRYCPDHWLGRQLEAA